MWSLFARNEPGRGHKVGPSSKLSATGMDDSAATERQGQSPTRCGTTGGESLEAAHWPTGPLAKKLSTVLWRRLQNEEQAEVCFCHSAVPPS